MHSETVYQISETRFDGIETEYGDTGKDTVTPLSPQSLMRISFMNSSMDFCTGDWKTPKPDMKVVDNIIAEIKGKFLGAGIELTETERTTWTPYTNANLE